MAKGFKIIDRNLGYKEILAEMKKLEKSPYVKVGVMGEKKHTGGSATNVEVAVFHEFGTSTVPERSFIRSTTDEQSRAWSQLTASLRSQIMKLGMRVEQALDIMGLKIKSDIQAKIRSNIPPPLKHREGTALIDTGQLINSIRFVKVMNGQSD
jgi:phage gpG-like protein